MTLPTTRTAAVAALTLLLAGCGGGSTGSATPPVAPTAAPTGVALSPGALTFAAPNAAPQTVTIGAQGNVGQVTVNVTGCQGIATLTIPNGALPQTGTVTPTGVGSCSIIFTPATGSAATLAITVQ